MTIVNYSVKRNTDRCKQIHNVLSVDAAHHNAACAQSLWQLVGAQGSPGWEVISYAQHPMLILFVNEYTISCNTRLLNYKTSNTFHQLSTFLALNHRNALHVVRACFSNKLCFHLIPYLHHKSTVLKFLY